MGGCFIFITSFDHLYAFYITYLTGQINNKLSFIGTILYIWVLLCGSQTPNISTSLKKGVLAISLFSK